MYLISGLVLFISILFYYFKNINSKKVIQDLITNNSTIKIGEDIIINNENVYEKLLNKGELGLAESYMDGDWTSNNLNNLLFKILNHQDIFERKIKFQSIFFIYLKIQSKLKSLFNTNTLTKSPDNIQKHYDVGNNLYKKMLGKTMLYTCAYFNKDNMSLDEAQLSKMKLIAKKLNLKPGMEILDIGCGFGSMTHYLADNFDVKVSGVTLSPEQKKIADEDFSHPNVTIEVKDYRLVTGKYDRVYSIGMFEHIGSRNYTEYFEKCYELLKDDGIMLVHCMGISKPNNHQNEYFASNYIFPEGELPDMVNFTKAYNPKWRLEDFQNIGISYSKTFDAWRDNIGEWENIDDYDDRFKRMWYYYLCLFAENFRYQNFLLFQNVFTKKSFNRENDCLYIRN